MAFAVSVAHGLSRLRVEYPTAAQALSEARNQVEHHATDIRIEIMATREEFTFEEFRSKMGAAARSVPLE